MKAMLSQKVTKNNNGNIQVPPHTGRVAKMQEVALVCTCNIGIFGF